jgi:hypothetical protein
MLVKPSSVFTRDNIGNNRSAFSEVYRWGTSWMLLYPVVLRNLIIWLHSLSNLSSSVIQICQPRGALIDYIFIFIIFESSLKSICVNVNTATKPSNE